MNFKVCEKRQSILDSKRHCLVLGGPGSGKTTLALFKAIKTIKEGLKPGQKILFLSFSRAAVARIADAAKTHIPHDQMALLSVQTFHSFFWSILQGHAYLLGAPRLLSIVPSHDEKALCGGIDRNDLLWTDWEERRRRLFFSEGRICFDLFAPLTADILTRNARLRNRMSDIYPLILIDEAQDTGNDQWECVRLLAEKSQAIFLADPEQMIYDHLPGVNPDRIPIIREKLNPDVIDFEGENNRSPGTEIQSFARDVFLGRTRSTSYQGISRMRFRANAALRNKAIRRGIGIIASKIKSETGLPAESIALIASYGRGVALISAALQLDKPIQHQVLFDEAFALLSSRIVAFLLEPKKSSNHNEDVAILLEMMSTAFRSKGKKTSTELAAKCVAYADRCRSGQFPKVNIVKAANALLISCREQKFSGVPGKDWQLIKQKIRELKEPTFSEISTILEYLVAFARRDRISENLSALWIKYDSYVNARHALDTALAQDQLLADSRALHGIHVMNWHKCKGKQFDGLILYRDSYSSPFVWAGDTPPYTRSRRLLHMAITRAKKHVLILDEVHPCPILDSFTNL